ncbi:predicted protein [Histoplasma mississippiense (nom. inval.)]|uniref:predicted protein n=1 Tax=Ajellomyces capsulatus (strain NAm1 / WU24) TaxID=2059318 RepID=UPI000157B668|nr:predicted protein [Histoplasma mississippiense (nom. inval.)]EDN02662.1 predicted protein [Histoplasma mississippiense (nom. inval.)]
MVENLITEEAFFSDCNRLAFVWPWDVTKFAASVAGTLAAAAYLDAKYLLRHDLSGGSIAAQAKDAVQFLTECWKQDKTLMYHVLEAHARGKNQDNIFVIFEGRSWSYKQFFEDVHGVGDWLVKDLGVERGELVALDGGNSPEYLLLWFGLESIAACLSFINCNLTAAPLVHCVKLCGARYLLADRGTEHLVQVCEEELKEANTQTIYYDSELMRQCVNTLTLNLASRCIRVYHFTTAQLTDFASIHQYSPVQLWFSAGSLATRPSGQRFVNRRRRLFTTDGVSSSFNANKGDFGLGAIGVRGLYWKWVNGSNEKRVKIDVVTEEIQRDTFRWKSENVSTNEVSDVLGKFDNIDETNVYGVLPRYAVPIFVRVVPGFETTGTMKLRKGKLRAQGIDLDKIKENGTSDGLFWLQPDGSRYTPFEIDQWEALKAGRIRL